MLGCLKSCIRHPKEKREKVRPGRQLKLDTVVDEPACLSKRRDCSTPRGENVALECAAPIVVEEVSQIEDDTKAEDTEDDVEEEPASKVMGMTEESAVHAELASATIPKERKFQVVRVPGVFTRGRWKCWDYRDDVKPIEGLTFTDDKENDSAGTVTVAASTSVSTTVSEPANNSPLREESSTIVVTSIAPAPPTPQHGTPSSISEMPTPPYTITEHHSATGDWGSSAPTTVTITSSQSPPQPPTDTVVVQSVSSPAAPSHQQQPIVVVAATASPSTTTASAFDAAPVAAAAAAAAQAMQQQQSPMASSVVVVEEREQQLQQGEAMNVSMTSSEAAGSVGGASTVSIGSGGAPSSLSSVSPPSITTSTTTPSPEMTRSGSEAAGGTPQVEEEPAAAAPAMSNAAAIDNKIEQAMDLVKTHLTFAVREEVEILRTTIAELESKVAALESQNIFLRRHVAIEVLNGLPALVSQHKMSLPATVAPPVQPQQPASATSAPSTSVSPALAAAVLQEQQQQAVVEAADAAAAPAATPAATPDPSPAAASAAAAAAATAATVSPTKPYCPATTNFVNSLNTVVNPPNPR